MLETTTKNYTALGLKECSMKAELDKAAEGTGLAFIVFAQAIVELPIAPFWSVIFFLMLLALGIGSQIGILEGMLCTIFDIDLIKRIRKEYITGEAHSLSPRLHWVGNEAVRRVSRDDYIFYLSNLCSLK